LKTEFIQFLSVQPKKSLEEEEIIKAEPNSLFGSCYIITFIQNQWKGVGKAINTLQSHLTITVP